MANGNTLHPMASFPLKKLWILLLAAAAICCCRAEEEQIADENTTQVEVHRWSWCNNGDQPCSIGKFCTANIGEVIGSVCDVCPPKGVPCESLNVTELGVKECLKFCNFGYEGDPCSEEQLCDPGNFFCDFQDGDSGVCRACSVDKTDCLSEDLMIHGKEDCLESCNLNCYPMDWTYVFIDNEEYDSLPLLGSPGLSASGPIVDCTNLIYEQETICPGAEGAICLVEDETNDIFNFQIVRKCQNSGGVGAILYADYYEGEEDNPFLGFMGFKETFIPSVTVSFNAGRDLRANRIGSMANITVDNIGQYCWKDMTCDYDIPCIGEYGEDYYCGYDWFDGGWCWKCPVDENDNPDAWGCFFDTSGLANEKIQVEVESCVENCAAELKFSSCKFCPEDLNPFKFGIENPQDKCYFCPENDIQYPDRIVPIFNGNVMCWQMQNFFNRIDINKHSQNCKLAQMMNYVCGCAGPGYGGADSHTKKAVLAWLPRVMAALSLLGSLFIVYDAVRTRQSQETTFCLLMLQLSFFDVLGSVGYLFTSLPLPADDYMYGSKGNESTCIAQGFFIQLGTISCYTNVSLAIYYLLVIKWSFAEEQLKKIRILLFGCPLLVGFVFAFTAIPHYDNMILWCNNAASWWPDIPVAVAIFVATIVMGLLWLDVYSKEKASSRWRESQSASRGSMSSKVSWQAFWYILAFYVTWIPYLALQYSWARGEAFLEYGFILFAGTMVPLQGAWNFFVYIRPRYLQGLSRRFSTRNSSSGGSGRLGSKRSENSVNKSSLQEKSQSQRDSTLSQESKVRRVGEPDHPIFQNLSNDGSSGLSPSGPLRISTSNLDAVPEPVAAETTLDTKDAKEDDAN